jgi:hypothetical protein
LFLDIRPFAPGAIDKKRASILIEDSLLLYRRPRYDKSIDDCVYSFGDGWQRSGRRTLSLNTNEAKTSLDGETRSYL